MIEENRSAEATLSLSTNSLTPSPHMAFDNFDMMFDQFDTFYHRQVHAD
jgi:hypothetical protein